MPSPPALSPDQRRQALQKAGEARRQRADIKASLKGGKMRLDHVLGSSPADAAAKMRVSAVLESLPGVGKIKARQIMRRLEISESRRLGGLGEKQRASLLREFE